MQKMPKFVTALLFIAAVVVGGGRVYNNIQLNSSNVNEFRAISFSREMQPGETKTYTIASKSDGTYISNISIFIEGKEPNPKEQPLKKKDFDSMWGITKNNLTEYLVHESELESLEDQGHIYLYIVKGEDIKWYRVPIGPKLESLLHNNELVKANLAL